MKKLSILLILALCICSTSVHAYIPPGVTGYTIYAGYVPQQYSLWCWAASAQNVAKVEYPTSTRSQTDIVTYVKGSAVNTWATHLQTKQAAEYACYNNKSFTIVFSGLSYAFLSDLIYNGHPIIAFLSAGAFQVGHYVLLIGWGISDLNENLVFYYDPANGGSYEYCTYLEFLSGSYNGMAYNTSFYTGG